MAQTAPTGNKKLFPFKKLGSEFAGPLFRLFGQECVHYCKVTLRINKGANITEICRLERAYATGKSRTVD